MTTSSFTPTAATISTTSSSIHGELRALIRVHRPVEPKSFPFAMAMKPARAACLASAGIASSRLPSTTSTSAISSGTLARNLSICGGTKWIMRSSLTGSSRSGVGAPTAIGLKKLRGSFMVQIPFPITASRCLGLRKGPRGQPQSTAQAKQRSVRTRVSIALLQRDVGLLDHLAPELHLFEEELRCVHAGLGDGFHLDAPHLFGNVWPGEDIDDVPINSVGQGCRGLRRCDHGVPSHCPITR